jgi:hypothetical protein
MFARVDDMDEMMSRDRFKAVIQFREADPLPHVDDPESGMKQC